MANSAVIPELMKSQQEMQQRLGQLAQISSPARTVVHMADHYVQFPFALIVPSDNQQPLSGGIIKNVLIYWYSVLSHMPHIRHQLSCGFTKFTDSNSLGE